MMLVLVGLVGTIVSCLLLGLALYYEWARIVSVIVFVVAIVSILAGTCFYLAEIRIALSSVRDEAKYYHLMDSRRGEPERRADWHR